MRIRDIMTTDVITISPASSLKEAARRMVEVGITMWIDPEEVEVRCEDGNVRLSGRLGTRTDARLLVELVKRVDGVASVADELSWEVDNSRQHRLTPPIGGFPSGI